MKKLKLNLNLNKETVARLNEEQSRLAQGGLAAEKGNTVVIDIPIGLVAEDAGEGDGCGKRSVIASKTCPSTSTCGCSC